MIFFFLYILLFTDFIKSYKGGDSMSDIKRIGNKYYDFGTKNTSFLLTAQELKVLGIKNWYFMLEVKRPDLGVQDIDPYNEKITAEEAGRLIIECKANPWFFFRECARVPVTGAAGSGVSGGRLFSVSFFLAVHDGLVGISGAAHVAGGGRRCAGAGQAEADYR